MGSARDVVEISSDEEEDSAVSRRTLFPRECVAKLFADLLVIGKLSAVVVARTQKKGRSGGVGDDDDCVVLDRDPDGAVTIADEKVGSVGDGSSDELEIVAEKVACRDFPHSRHSCSNLPFSTTFHRKHCCMCYCFVCDAPAPCTYWGSGLWNDGHCHATDKEAQWKALREEFRRKSILASHPENHQNVVHPTMASPRQQDTQCHVSAPQSHPSLIPNISLFSVPRQKPVPSVARHSAVRVTPNAGRTVGAPGSSPAPRAGKGAAERINLPKLYRQEEDEEYDDWEYAEPPEEATLYVGNLNYNIDREYLAELFDHAGIVEASKVIYNGETYQSRGFGFVTMRYAEDADKAVKMFHRREAEGRVLTVTKADRRRGARVERPPRKFGSSPFRIYVGNLPWHVDDCRLNEFFSDYSRVVDANVVYDDHTMHSRGFGFVTMLTREEMDFTVGLLNGKVFWGHALRVEVASGGDYISFSCDAGFILLAIFPLYCYFAQIHGLPHLLAVGRSFLLKLI